MKVYILRTSDTPLSLKFGDIFEIIEINKDDEKNQLKFALSETNEICIATYQYPSQRTSELVKRSSQLAKRGLLAESALTTQAQ